MPRGRRNSNPDQLGLLIGTGIDTVIECKGVFSPTYLYRHFKSSPEFASESETRAAYDQITGLWNRYATTLPRRSEAFTCSIFLEPIMDLLGWRRIPQESMPSSFGMRKRPDYCLFSNEESFNAASSAENSQLFRLSATVLEAKKAGHPLDQVSETETPGWFPSQQIQDYLNHAKDSSGRRFFNWAVLTNAFEWRLYTERSAVGAYFSFHLIQNGHPCSFEEFRLFFSLFRASSLERGPEGLCLLDNILDQALHLQANLESNLRRRIFNVLEDLGTAFVNFPDNHLTEEDYPQVYENSLIFLYRLLFILYAESRGLLPVKPFGPGSNSRYRNTYSLAHRVDRLRDQKAYDSTAFTDLYEELLRLFNLINGTNERQNTECGVTRYNGGLFDPREHPILERWRIDDKALANVLRQLIFAQPPTRPSQRQMQFSTDEAIDYSTLEVRQLGDIYEGLLGAHFKKVDGRLELQNENGENHRHGIFYTPDWIVQFLIRETLTPLLKQIEAHPDVERALSAKSEERRRNNSFALGVLRLNIVDPAMGSGHFLVRATEWLADQIMRHLTTRTMTMQIVAHGQRHRSREEILAQGKIAVSPGVPQEQAELAYWRRRVVEACIYGVDINPMAVELAKLSLWLTCIAADEPLNFLDHHLRHGNALLWASPEELRRAPFLTGESEQQTFDLGDRLESVLGGVIRDTLSIETTASTEMGIVKEKERLWKEAHSRLQPFLDLSDIWLAALADLPIDTLNYLSVARYLIDPRPLHDKERREAEHFLESIRTDLDVKKQELTPFHWELEFPDVFYGEDGRPLSIEQRGFDAVLGNPPYISTHTSSAEQWRTPLGRRDGYLDDLYVHFADLGFRILRKTGGFGFIVSDTFFTLSSKEQMRRLLQTNRLTHLGQCDPFNATVDAAVFVAWKGNPPPDSRILFVQARPLRRPDGSRTVPDVALPELPPWGSIQWNEASTRLGEMEMEVFHKTENELRVHDIPIYLFTNAHKRAFFEPSRCALALYERFNEPVKKLVKEWWDKIEDSKAFAAHFPEISTYQSTLRPGDITLAGLIAQGGQGMRTANNARFIAYLEGTEQAEEIEIQSCRWSEQWIADKRVGPRFRKYLLEAGGNVERPTGNRAAWEAAVHQLREEFEPSDLGFKKMSLYRIAPRALIADDKDFVFAWQQRKEELFARWKEHYDLQQFWNLGVLVEGRVLNYQEVYKKRKITDEEFCRLCQHLHLWIYQENGRRRRTEKISVEVLGLRSSENYFDPTDAPRIATIYNGLCGRGQFVPFRKGDPEGSRWIDNEPLYIEWSRSSVDWLSTNPLARWQGHKLFLTPGVTWSLHANHVAIKSRYQEPCIFDASSSRLTPILSSLSARVFLAIVNSDVFSFFLKKFIKHNQDVEINDMRMQPIVIPTEEQHERLEGLASLAIACKRHEFAATMPTNDIVSRVRLIGQQLRSRAQQYLHPSAQELLLASAEHCLSVIELAVNWEAEKLYGVEGLGPFDEF